MCSTRVSILATWHAKHYVTFWQGIILVLLKHKIKFIFIFFTIKLHILSSIKINIITLSRLSKKVETRVVNKNNKWLFVFKHRKIYDFIIVLNSNKTVCFQIERPVKILYSIIIYKAKIYTIILYFIQKFLF